MRDGKLAATGESGNIVVTTLKHYAMPMIRYDTNDIGRISPDSCPCGRGLTVLRVLEGRSGDILRLGNGRIVSPNYCCRLMMSPEFVGAFKQFQVVQTGDLTLDLKLVRSATYIDSDADAVVRAFKQSLGSEVRVNLSLVERIDPMPSGKFQVSRRSRPFDDNQGEFER